MTLWRRGRRRPADITAADSRLVATLDALDGATNYRDWILELAAPHLAGAHRILEVGAGHGTFTGELTRFGEITAVELGHEAFTRLAERFTGVTRVVVSDTPIDDLEDEAFDAAFLSNVLEHIEDDVSALAALARIVRPGGRVIVFSPAFPSLYSEFDARIGHHHRYRLRELRRRFDAAGLTVIDGRYVNSLGFFSWLVLVRMLRFTPEQTVLVHVFDRWIVPVLHGIERRFPPPFGQSVFVAGTPSH